MDKVKLHDIWIHKEIGYKVSVRGIIVHSDASQNIVIINDYNSGVTHCPVKSFVSMFKLHLRKLL